MRERHDSLFLDCSKFSSGSMAHDSAMLARYIGLLHVCDMSLTDDVIYSGCDYFRT